jgi:glycine hydroxymethyltransferase
MYDKLVEKLIKAEEKRQREGLELIPSENYVSEDVLTANGSIFTNKYSEGYPGRRYYGGQDFTDAIESLAIKQSSIHSEIHRRPGVCLHIRKFTIK